MKLKQGIALIEKEAGDGEVIAAYLCHARQVYRTEGGLYWAINRKGSAIGFRSLLDAMQGIEADMLAFPYEKEPRA